MPARRLTLIAAATCLVAGLLCWSAAPQVGAAEPAADEWERMQFVAKGLPQTGAGADAYDLYRARVPDGWLVIGDDGGVNGVIHVPDPEHAWKKSETQRWEARSAKGVKRSIPPQANSNTSRLARSVGLTIGNSTNRMAAIRAGSVSELLHCS